MLEDAFYQVKPLAAQVVSTCKLLMEEILRQLIVSFSLSHHVQGLIHPGWCRISSINSSVLLSVCYTYINYIVVYIIFQYNIS